MAPHSSTLAWKIPRTEEPGGLQSTGSLRVRHDWATSLSLFTFMHWRRQWYPTPVFLPGESQGRRSLVGCRLCGRTQQQQQSLSCVRFFMTPWTVAPRLLCPRDFQARILEWVVISFSRGYSQPRDQTWVSWTGRQILYHWSTREALQTATIW